MVKTYLYLPEELDRLIAVEANTTNTSKAETIRRLISLGIQTINNSKSTSASLLSDAGKIGDEYTFGEKYKDISSNIDKYIWEENPNEK